MHWENRTEKNIASTFKNSYDLQEAVGQYQVYRSVLGKIAPERQLYLAGPQRVHEGIWKEETGWTLSWSWSR
jgi:hypothetical protein